MLISIPIFVIGSFAQLIFGVRLGWFPVTATQGTTYQLIMPAFVLASASLAYIARLMRANLGGEPACRLRSYREGEGAEQQRARWACTRCVTP